MSPTALEHRLELRRGASTTSVAIATGALVNRHFNEGSAVQRFAAAREKYKNDERRSSGLLQIAVHSQTPVGASLPEAVLVAVGESLGGLGRLATRNREAQASRT